MAESDDQEKPYEPSQKRLDDARKKGELARSTDLNTAAGYFGFLVAVALFGQRSLANVAEVLSGLIAQADHFAKGGTAAFSPVYREITMSIGPLFAVPAGFVVVSLILQRAIVFAPTRMAPKLNKISPLSGFKNKFGRAGLFEFAKSVGKLAIFSVLLGFFLAQNSKDLIAGSQLQPEVILVFLSQLLLKFLALVVVIAGMIGALDYLFQWAEHQRKNRMSHKDMVDEQKESDGDPHLKGKRRQKAQEIAFNQMMADVPKADVVIVNPTHYAVALKWTRGSGQVPVCVAKGVDEIALKIRAIAQENAVPIQSDPPTARALFATVELGEPIHPEHYHAVAAAIRFADAMRTKARQRGW